jgi:hypothetical protein
VLSRFEGKTEPFQEAEIADALRTARSGQGDIGDEDWKGFIAEWAAFLFGERRRKDGVWGTYFIPMMSAKKDDGSDFFSPDIKDLDAEVVAHWEARVKACGNPVMRARYSALVWDLKTPISTQKPSPECPRIAIDSYLEATEKKLYSIEINGIHWLERALDLSRSIKDSARSKRVVDSMFEFYDRVADHKFIGTWIFLFDDLYAEGIATPDQETQIIANLETMLATTCDATPTDAGVYPNLDPWGAEAAATRLAQHYRRQNNKQEVQRVIRSYGGAVEQMARQVNPMMATAWLQPVIERYQQEGLKTEAENLQITAEEKGKHRLGLEDGLRVG